MLIFKSFTESLLYTIVVFIMGIYCGIYFNIIQLVYTYVYQIISSTQLRCFDNNNHTTVLYSSAL